MHISDLPRDLWDASTRRFSGGNLRRELVMRGMTPETFGPLADLTPATIYRAIRGGVCRDETVFRILKALLAREPVVQL